MRAGIDRRPGQTALDIVQTHGPFGAEEAALIGRDVCLALDVLHRAGCVHGAVTAVHVFREVGGRVLLVDVARRHPNDVAEDSAYDPVPQLSPTAPTPQSDLHGVGALLFYLVTSTLPESKTRLRDVRPDLPERFIQLVERVLGRDPRNRVESAQSLAIELSRILSGADVVTSTPSGTHRRVLAAGVAVAFVVGVSAWVLRTTSDASTTRPGRTAATSPCDTGTSGTSTMSNVEPRIWHPLTPMPTARLGLALTTLNCRLFAMGGATTPNDFPSVGAFGVSAAEVYDPSTDSWAPVSRLPIVRAYPNGAAVISGRIYLPGGSGCDAPGCRETNSLFIFDPAVGSQGVWTIGSPMPAATQHGTSAAIDGLLYVTAGWSAGGQSRSVFRFDPVTSVWKRLSDMPKPHVGGAGAVLGGKLYLSGGQGNQHGLDIYDPITDAWTSMTMPVGYEYHAAVAVGGRLVLVGGTQLVSGVHSEEVVLAFDPRTNEWTTTDPVASTGGPYSGRVGEELAMKGRSTATFARLPTGFHLAGATVVGTVLYVAGGWDTTQGMARNALFALDAGDSESLAYLWDFGDGGQASGPNPTHRYQAPGRYTVTLTVSTLDGRQSRTTALAIITEDGRQPVTPAAELPGDDGKSQPRCAPTPAGLTHWWPGEGSSGDIVGGDHGITIGTVSYARGMVGQAFQFGEGHIRLAHNYGGVSAKEATVLAWIQTQRAGPAAWQSILSSTTTGFIHFQTSTAGGAGVYTGAGRALHELPSVGPAPVGVWRHIALTARSGELRVYQNGVAISQLADTFTYIAPQIDAVLIGAGYGTGRSFPGLVDELQTYDRALTATEIRSIYAAGREGLCRATGSPDRSTPTDTVPRKSPTRLLR